MRDDLHYLNLSEAAALIQARQISSLELTTSCLERIGSVDRTVHAFLTVTREHALQQASQADEALGQGDETRPLLGVPIALKDLYQTKAIRTTASSDALATWLPDEDATTTRLLAEAGTVLLGKLAMNEFAFGMHDFEHQFKPAHNPWNLEHVPGGSSSGSGAALAAGLCYGALGSDTGGSIRSPAAFCGIVGLKPTYGRVSRYGVVPLSWSLDHCGPMARTVEDCAMLLQAIAAFDEKDAASANIRTDDYVAGLEGGVKALRLGVPRGWFTAFEGTDPQVMSAFDEALKVLESEGAILTEVAAEPFLEANAVNLVILLAEATAFHEGRLRTEPELLGPDARDLLMYGGVLSAVDYVQAQRARAGLSRQINDILKDVDAIVTPSATQQAGAFADADPYTRDKQLTFTSPFNLVGLPAVSVPCGFSAAGLPLGLQIAGRPFEEALVLRTARAYERVTDWHRRHPEI